jgi:SAM-dependent methyltransferase
MKKELLLGCGSDKAKRLKSDPTDSDTWNNLTTLDYNADHKPDVIWDLNIMPYPFNPNTFDEIHAYEVLEHTGTQGDYKFFFAQFTELHRILKPNGYLLATCPSRHSVWAWGDPSHTRILQKEQLVFLEQWRYMAVGETSMSDFRSIYKVNFEIVAAEEDADSLKFILKATK